MIHYRTALYTALLAIFLLISQPLWPQSVTPVFSKTHSDEVFHSKWGPNKKHYATGFIRLTEPVSLSSWQAVKIAGSLDFTLGGRYKRRFCNFYSTGFDIFYSTASYNMKNPGELLKVKFMTEIDKERFANHSIAGAWFHRFNYGRRGDHLGKYIEAGVYGQYHFAVRHKFEGKDQNFDITATTSAVNKLVNRSAWGFQAGVGFNKFKVFAQYRMIDYLKPEYSKTDITPLRVGLEIDLGG